MIPDVAVRSSEAGPRPGSAGGGFRGDVQGLRALAVAMVVVYHLYPSLLPGGFAGVDVFFVISGFLITGHLWREYRATGTVSLVGFWGRRAKRLLPAASLVLAVTWLASLEILPPPELQDAAVQVRASALYFQNWQLAGEAVNYLTSSNTASPVQHFWSLSVEEQFYIGWPLLFLVGAAVAWAVRRRWPDRAGRTAGYAVIGILTALVVLASLAYSYQDTRADASAAYFVTTTRIWELGVGGLLALASERITAALGRQGWLSWAGLALCVVSAFVLNGSMPFPGVLALLPVAGAVLMIACGSPAGRYGTGRLMALPPLVFLGGISYSLYLWHWPVISLWTTYRGHPVGAIMGPVIIVVSVVVAWLSKTFVEDPVRKARVLSKGNWRSLTTVAAVIVPVALVTGYIAAEPVWNGQLGHGYVGAAAMADSAPSYPVKPPLPASDAGSALLPLYWQQGCLQQPTDKTVKPCFYGDTSSPTKTIALVGDSIAGNWMESLDTIAKEQHWRLVVVLHGDCAWSATPTWNVQSATACGPWGTALTQYLLKLHPALVVTSSSQNPATEDQKTDSAAEQKIGAGMATYWRQLQAAGIKVAPIQSTPHLTIAAFSCLSRYSTDYAEKCTQPRSQAILANTALTYAVAAMDDQVPLIDMNQYFCTATTCPVVIGNVVLYFDNKHLTRSYAQTLAPYLEVKLRAAFPALFTGA
ncbi:MAG TPA: acyltransferase family protein [Trebonia sp.]|nr:acyltransferase family protein [Trebonia sp.]